MAAERIPKIISFSGIDGAGKSTQIGALESWLAAAGLRVLTLSMWDHVVVGARYREIASRTAFRGDQGIGTPQNPLHRRDKNVRSRPLTLIRCLLYFADSLHLRMQIRKLQKSADSQVVIFDRYIYDELANLPLDHSLARRFARFLLKVAPQPDVAFLVDAVPEIARARKPEYPLEFLRKNRQSYLALRDLAPNLNVIHSGSVEDMERTIRIKLRWTRSAHDPHLAPLGRQG